MIRIFLLIFPFFLISQESIVVGDVDCNGVLNSEDASLILQFITNSIDSLPCPENSGGIDINQLQEIIELIDSELLVNNISSFDNWLLISDSPTFDDYIFGQSEKDGFLLFQYSRENQINSSASFGFSFYTGSELDTTDYNMDVKIDIRSSWNPLNTKTIPVKSGDYWLLKNTDDLYPTNVKIDKIYFISLSQSSTFSNINDEVDTSNESDSSPTTLKNITFPDGCCGQAITWDLASGNYIVPEGKNLYITQYFNSNQSSGLNLTSNNSSNENYLQELQIVKGYSNHILYTGVGFSPSNSNNLPIIVGAGDAISGSGSFNGFVIDAKVESYFTQGVNSSEVVYTVPEGKNLFIMQYCGDSSGELKIDGVKIFENYGNYIFYTGVGYTPAITLSHPIILGPGQQISLNGVINGYIAPSNYFTEQ